MAWLDVVAAAEVVPAVASDDEASLAAADADAAVGKLETDTGRPRALQPCDARIVNILCSSSRSIAKLLT